MVRRCLDGDRRFGMLGSPDPHTPDEGEGHSVGSEVEIKDSRQLHDGRYHIQVPPCPRAPPFQAQQKLLGFYAHRDFCGLQVAVVRRFFIEEMWEMDGYRVARVSFVHDVPEGSGGGGAAPGTVSQPAPATTPQPDGGGASGGASGGPSGGASGGASGGPREMPSASNDPILQRLSEDELAKHMQMVVKEWLVRPPPPCSCAISIWQFAEGGLRGADPRALVSETLAEDVDPLPAARDEGRQAPSRLRGARDLHLLGGQRTAHLAVGSAADLADAQHQGADGAALAADDGDHRADADGRAGSVAAAPAAGRRRRGGSNVLARWWRRGGRRRGGRWGFGPGGGVGREQLRLTVVGGNCTKWFFNWVPCALPCVKLAGANGRYWHWYE